MTTLTIHPDEHGRWQWKVGREHSTLGYATVEDALANAKWQEVEFTGFTVRTTTDAHERALGEDLIWQHERSKA